LLIAVIFIGGDTEVIPSPVVAVAIL